MYFDEFDKRKLLLCYVIICWLYLMVIVLCDWWKYHKYVCGERILGFRVETRV